MPLSRVSQLVLWKDLENTCVGHRCEYFKDTKELHCWHKWHGFYSSCTEVIYMMIELFNRGYEVDKIDFTQSCWRYKKNAFIDFYDLMFLKNDSEVDFVKTIELPPEDTSSSNIFKYNFDPKFVEYCGKIVQKYFNPSKEIEKRMEYITKKYNLTFDKLLAVYYRGTDKKLECTLADPDEYLSFAKNFLIDNPDHKILIQSDENGVIKLFKDTFKEKCICVEESCFSDELRHKVPKKFRKGDGIHFYLEYLAQEMSPEENIIWFDSTVRCMAKCDHILTYTGNVSSMMKFYRKNIVNVHQFDEHGVFQGVYHGTK